MKPPTVNDRNRPAVVVIDGRPIIISSLRVFDKFVLSTIAYPVFDLGLQLSITVLERRYWKMWQNPIPYRNWDFPDLVSYLRTLKGIVVTRNSISNVFQVSADKEIDPSTLSFYRHCRLPGDLPDPKLDSDD